jgi:hypothetical protein
LLFVVFHSRFLIPDFVFFKVSDKRVRINITI